ncbi:MAG TPA: shikimate kinase [Candidatus Limnocylindrales bacterium]|nr:shikimate kinase [Candidatus Limnocylindrales bacterium]
MAEPGSERVFLVGMVGSGKTTIGRALSDRTGWPYLDNDDLVERLTGRKPAEIYATDGEDVLHVAEARALDAALDMDPPVIVGVAGFIVDDPAAREALRDGGHVVWLRARPDTLISRMRPDDGRRADAHDPDWVRARVREREPLYAAAASQIIDVDDTQPAEVVDLILGALSER